MTGGAASAGEGAWTMTFVRTTRLVFTWMAACVFFPGAFAISRSIAWAAGVNVAGSWTANASFGAGALGVVLLADQKNHADRPHSMIKTGTSRNDRQGLGLPL